LKFEIRKSIALPLLGISSTRRKYKGGKPCEHSKGHPEGSPSSPGISEEEPGENRRFLPGYDEEIPLQFATANCRAIKKSSALLRCLF
jgi:hypothetical protein